MSAIATAAAVKALAETSTILLELVTAWNKAALIIQQRHAHGGDYTPEEQAAVDDMVRISKLNRQAALTAAEQEGR